MTGYGGTNVGASVVSDSKGNAGLGTSLALGSVLGFNLNKYIAIEGALNMAFDKAYIVPVTVAVFARAPITEKTAVYGKAGASYMTIMYTAYSVSGVTGMYGFGVELSPDSVRSVRIGVDHYDLSVGAGTSVSSNFIGLTNISRF